MPQGGSAPSFSPNYRGSSLCIKYYSSHSTAGFGGKWAKFPKSGDSNEITLKPNTSESIQLLLNPFILLLNPFNSLLNPFNLLPN
jgi:hypothetical protein